MSLTRFFVASFLLLALAIPLTSTSAQAAGALEVWDNAARIGLPLWLKAWLGFLALAFVASVFFVRRHVAARWVLAGFIASHVVTAFIDAQEGMVLRAGLVSLLHVVFWTPGFVVLLLKRSEITLSTAYGKWAWVILLVYAVAFTFDIRDSVIWANFMLG